MEKMKFKTGKVEIPEDAFSPKNTKIRISMMIEADLLVAYKEAAKSTSHGEYQTLMKEKLRAGIQQESREIPVVAIMRSKAMPSDIDLIQIIRSEATKISRMEVKKALGVVGSLSSRSRSSVKHKKASR